MGGNMKIITIMKFSGYKGMFRRFEIGMRST